MTIGVPAPVADAIRTLVDYAQLEHADPWKKYPAVLQVKHVAEILDLTENAVCMQVRRGRKNAIPMVRRNGRYVIDQVEFRRWAGYGAFAARDDGAGA
jgi:hypothetical protein